MRLTPIQTRHIEPGGVTGFVSFHQQVFGVREELPSGWNHVARRKCLLLSDPGGKEYEVRRHHVLPQDQSPLAIG